MSTINDIIVSLPRPIRLRFDSIGGYVQGIIAEQEESLPVGRHLRSEEVDLVKLIAFCYAATRLFREGSSAARSAVDELALFEIPGFQIGSVLFHERNENVMLGDTLADDMMRAFEGTPFQRAIVSSTSMNDLVKTVSRRLRHGGRVG